MRRVPGTARGAGGAGRRWRRGGIAVTALPALLAAALAGRKVLLRLFTRLTGTWVGRST